MQTESAVRVRGLQRRYGTGADAFEAVRDIDLDVETGSVTALLGTNGAGKTSTLEVIEGLAAPFAGEVRVLGLDPRTDRAAVRRRTGVLLQRSGFSGDLSVTETLRMWASTLTSPRPVAEMVELLDLESRAGVRMRGLSGGEQRRVDLACALMGDPELVLLDEPTTGLDPESRRRVWRLIEDLRDRGRTVLLTTHYLEEVEALADRVSIMHAGRIVREGTPAEIVAGHDATVRLATPERALPDLPGERTDHDGTTRISTRDLQATLTALLAWAAEHDVALSGLDARSASLESVFLEIAAEQPADDRASNRADGQAVEVAR